MSLLKASEHGIKRVLFGLLRLLLRKGRSDLQLSAKDMKRVLFLRPEKIGDMVISLPTFEALRSAHPHIELGVLASPGNEAVVRHDPRFTWVHLYKKNLSDFGTLARVREVGYDCVIDMIDGDSMTTLVYSQLIGGGAARIGVGKERHAAFYDFNYSHADGVGEHIIENTLQLLTPLGVDIAAAERFVPPHVEDTVATSVDAFIASLLQPGESLIGLNLSAGRPNRIWPQERVQEFAQRLLDSDNSLRLVIVVTPADRQRGEELMNLLGERKVSIVPDKLSLLGVSHLVSKLRLLVSPDTSLIHIARSYRVPVVGLYNRAGKNFTRWQPYEQTDGAVVGEHIDTIYDIDADTVLESVMRQLRLREESAP